MDSCWICGSEGPLTHEHIYKASDIRRHFYKTPTVIVGEDGNRFAQGPKSDALKFKSPICQACNTSRTQEADLAYDCFLRELKRLEIAEPPFGHPTLKDFEVGGKSYLPLFRYFGKILGNEIADMGGPIPTRLRSFVSGASTSNCINLSITPNPNIHLIRKAMPDTSVISSIRLIATRKGRRLATLATIRDVNKIRFYIYFQINFFEFHSIRRAKPDFLNLCMKSIEENPVRL